jgi:phage gp46-like protein
VDLKIYPDIELRDLTTDDLKTAVYISLFTDRRADSDDPVDNDNRGGYWGDSLETDPLGSRLWILRRAKITSDTIGLIEKYCLEALQWLIDDNIASQIIVTPERNSIDKFRVDIPITITRPNGVTETLNYSLNWRETFAV